MPAPAVTFAGLLAEVRARARHWKRSLDALEAEELATPDPNPALIAQLDDLSDELVLLRVSADAPVVRGEPPADLTTAWEAVQAAFAREHDFSDQKEAVQRTRQALDNALEAFGAEAPDTQLFEGATLGTAELETHLTSAIPPDRWRQLERDIGERIPDDLRRAAFEVEATPDRFDGRAGVLVRVAPWAGEALREGLRRILAQEALPSLGSADAMGEPSADEAESHQVCRIYFGTNRAGHGSQFENSCSTADDPLRFGQALVSVPNRRRRGDVPRPWKVAGLSLPEQSDKHILLVEEPHEIGRTAFVEALRAACDPGDAFLFVHGYNAPFRAGFWRTAQLAVDLEVEGPILHYAWPSAGKPTEYDYDAESIRASVTPFKSFVRTVLADGGIRKLNVVVHSKGGELVLDAFADLTNEGSLSGGGHLVLASPDVADDVARDWLRRAPAFFRSVTLYANGHDRPLALSRAKARRDRIGALQSDGAPFIMDGMDSIDAGEADFEIFGFNHDAYVRSPVLMYDLAALLRRGVRPPDHRSPVIRPRTCERGLYYRVVT
jgi:esterase/lipase superfamily enzyme